MTKPFEEQRLGTVLKLRRCPHCGDANPQLIKVHQTDKIGRATEGETSVWAMFACYGCGSAILAQGQPGNMVSNPPVEAIFPPPASVDVAIPEPARTFLTQAQETLHAPDAAAVMAGSAVDAMLKKLEYTEGSVYNRIDQALKDNKITAGMAEWAHWVRLGANRPRHSDKEKPHVTKAEAKQAVEFAEALGYFLFVLTDRISAGIGDATKAAGGK